MDRYDVVVVGAGAFGLGSAYHLARRGAGRIALVDSLPGPGQGNTGRSVGGFRKGLFTSELNRMLSESTVAFLADLQRSGVDLGMHSVGYLVLLNGPQLEANERAIRELVRRGNARLIDAGELKGLVPWMRLEFDGDEEAAILGLRNVEAALFSGQSGYLDVEKLVGYLHREVLDAGVEPRFNERVRRLRLGPVVSIGHPREPLAWQEKRVEALETDRGELRADVVVLATGAWINELLDPIGIDSHVKPKKRQVFSIEAKGGLRRFFEVEGFNGYSSLPMTFFPRGPYVVPRVRERVLWTGMSDDVGRPWGIDFSPEESFYLDNIYPTLSKVFPVLRDVRPTSMWAGCYSINTIDENPIAFRSMNLVVVTGGSGSGVMKFDAMSRVAASLALGEEEAVLYTGERLPVSWLGIRDRRAEPESFVF
ncbi:MAG: FAD-binding oxidoreductase [Thaumarchaeota archaeon]|nr:FAD-binding oxidoreductase [Candidatus Calditenuaceae archaeon]MDW8042701.1 FAD-binding oxidoreductase [Nitrososphaerota archaeon]